MVDVMEIGVDCYKGTILLVKIGDRVRITKSLARKYRCRFGIVAWKSGTIRVILDNDQELAVNIQKLTLISRSIGEPPRLRS